MKALITGTGGLIGSQCVISLIESGWHVLGIDNDQRQAFFGPEASTSRVVAHLTAKYRDYEHQSIDIRDRGAILSCVREYRPELIIHAAAQPSHDKAAAIPFEDFDTNAVGTLNLLVAARDFCRDAPFCFTSTNKVYGDRPNQLPIKELSTRYDYADDRDGIDESLSVDACLHSLFGASKLAADVLCQEFGRYFDMPVGVFRGGCLTGPQHAAVQLHGYLNFIAQCAVTGKPYTLFGYKGKQVRDQIHAEDVARLFLAFAASPRSGEVYNIGGGRKNSVSVLETLSLLRERGYNLTPTYVDTPRRGDHICYITDLTKVKQHFPGWSVVHSLSDIMDEITQRYALEQFANTRA